MMKRIGILMMLLAVSVALRAQQYTYNHDPMKQNQITVMESGMGSLTPSWYYNSLHEKYAKNAARKNKTLYRTDAGNALFMQRDPAESIDSAMTKRAVIEALNIADRTGGESDLAWSAEGPKVTAKMMTFMNNINRIVFSGGSIAERDYWMQYYNVYHSAIKNTQDAYMPNAQRKREYLRIYADITAKNSLLVKFLIRVRNRQHITEILSAQADTSKADKPNVMQLALVRWKAAIGMTSGRTYEE